MNYMFISLIPIHIFVKREFLTTLIKHLTKLQFSDIPYDKRYI